MKFKRYVTRMLAMVMVLGLSACVINVGKDGEYHSDWGKREVKNRDIISSLVVDTQEALVREQLGKPDFSEGYSRADGQYRVLFYRTQRQQEDGITTKDECTPLVFKNGVLVGWGEPSYNEIVKP
ncbi:DUF3192 domain-containing protein [Simiduia sp. 21SJ11W-1]|uniref:DUF3192 domain-containing protein n=1 Tax=Simiduia sp. 21SJ11W-1 TaxID=2909669 RepID=UPI00209F9EC9|nr:DUF3192 domain-containing protein [Simiduia sp. 21SJ11W-1]UTA47247.1 DUF3192 domain-containing protein [Simiduia sp. 21SJ11W-1]